MLCFDCFVFGDIDFALWVSLGCLVVLYFCGWGWFVVLVFGCCVLLVALCRLLVSAAVSYLFMLDFAG